MRNNRLKDAEIKEIKRTTSRIGGSTGHEMEPVMDIKTTNMTQTTDPKEEIEMHNNHNEDNGERLVLERRDLSSPTCKSKTHLSEYFYGKWE